MPQARSQRATRDSVPNRTVGPSDAIALATQRYLADKPLDMSVLAAELGVGRATLYRWVGNRENVVSRVLSEATERTLDKAIRHATGSGARLILDTMHQFMHAVLDAPALNAFTKREPLLFIRLALIPGAVESSAATRIANLLNQESAAGHLELALPAPVLADAIVRICDSHLYAQLLGRTEPEIDTALELTAMLLGAHHAPTET